MSITSAACSVSGSACCRSRSQAAAFGPSVGPTQVKSASLRRLSRLHVCTWAEPRNNRKRLAPLERVDGATHEMSEESFDDVYGLKVKADYFLVAELAPFMVQRGKGAIVNVSTMVADYGLAGMGPTDRAKPPLIC
jgi:NAD(P)-dependent dehydrogenase (short-subunit alcohol dehydrogenase family)